MRSPCADFAKEVTALIRQQTIRFKTKFLQKGFLFISIDFILADTMNIKIKCRLEV